MTLLISLHMPHPVCTLDCLKGVVRTRVRSCPTLADLMDSLLCPWTLPRKNTGVGFLPQGIFLIHGWNLCFLCLLHWQADSLPLCHLGSPPWIIYGVSIKYAVVIKIRWLIHIMYCLWSPLTISKSLIIHQYLPKSLNPCWPNLWNKGYTYNTISPYYEFCRFHLASTKWILYFYQSMTMWRRRLS